MKISYINELPTGAIPLDDAVEVIWNQLETKIGYDIRTIKKCCYCKLIDFYIRALSQSLET